MEQLSFFEMEDIEVVKKNENKPDKDIYSLERGDSITYYCPTISSKLYSAIFLTYDKETDEVVHIRRNGKYVITRTRNINIKE